MSRRSGPDKLPESVLSGKTAIVTGATRGIGFAIARRLLASGLRVAVGGSSEESANRAVERLGPGAVPVAADLSQARECDGLVDKAVALLGGVDVLVNNAGVGVFKPIGELSGAEWRAQIDLNLSGVFFCSKAALPHLVASDDAHIVNIGSLAGRHAFARGTGYNASKFGLMGLTEAMMLDVRYQGVRVSMVMPGSVATEFGGRPPGAGADWRLSAEDCADAVVHVVSYPSRAHASRIELRPSQPRRRS